MLQWVQMELIVYLFKSGFFIIYQAPIAFLIMVINTSCARTIFPRWFLLISHLSFFNKRKMCYALSSIMTCWLYIGQNLKTGGLTRYGARCRPQTQGVGATVWSRLGPPGQGILYVQVCTYKNKFWDKFSKKPDLHVGYPAQVAQADFRLPPVCLSSLSTDHRVSWKLLHAKWF